MGSVDFTYYGLEYLSFPPLWTHFKVSTCVYQINTERLDQLWFLSFFWREREGGKTHITNSSPLYCSVAAENTHVLLCLFTPAFLLPKNASDGSFCSELETHSSRLQPASATSLCQHVPSILLTWRKVSSPFHTHQQFFLKKGKERRRKRTKGRLNHS